MRAAFFVYVRIKAGINSSVEQIIAIKPPYTLRNFALNIIVGAAKCLRNITAPVTSEVVEEVVNTILVVIPDDS